MFAVVLLWAALWAFNNSLPYLGLRDDSCQTMFSGMASGQRWNNHLWIPQHALSDVGSYVEIRDLQIRGDLAYGREQALAAWLSQPRRAFNAEALRSVVAQLCSNHTLSFRARNTDQRDFISLENACRYPRYAAPHRLVPVRLFESDYPYP